jgi:hypothetical protein
VSTSTATPVPRLTERPAVRTAGALGAELFFYALMWAGIALALTALNLVGNGVWGADDPTSAWEGTSVLLQYVMIAGGLMVAVNHLPLYVTHGVTRRDFAAGTFLTFAGLAVGAALAATLAFAVERVVFAAFDWSHVLGGDPTVHLYDSPDQYGVIFVELATSYAAHLVGGLVIGAALYRLGWVVGSAVMLAGVAVIIGAEMAVATGLGGAMLGWWFDADPLHAALGVAIALGLAVVGALVARALIVGTPVETTDAAWWR